jgi:glycosyltransferase involved in cell wall biosynthesis
VKIVMFTNAYTPHVGGVAQSVSRFTRRLRQRGHRVLVVCPTFADQPDDEQDVIRLPSVQHVTGGDFSLAWPLSPDLPSRLTRFEADAYHAHHPFLLGNSALRAAASRDMPIVFTHHTMFEDYTHYAPVELTAMKSYIASLATGFANLCDRIVAPSDSTGEILAQRGVRQPIDVVPTGVDIEEFTDGYGARARDELGIPLDAPVIGHVGRLAPEKNLAMLSDAVVRALTTEPDAWWLVVGKGPSQELMRQKALDAGVGDRCVFAGVRTGEALVDAYSAMDVFAFASRTETQGMVLVEAMSTGCPVVALDAPGAREVARDGLNGRLVAHEDPGEMAAALCWVLEREGEQTRRLRDRARQDAEDFSTARCTDKLEDVYGRAVHDRRQAGGASIDDWEGFVRAMRTEWEIWSNRVQSLGKAIGGDSI